MYTAITVVWSAALVVGILCLIWHRRSPFVRIRNLKIAITSTAFLHIPGDRFRYVVVKPGQTVYFPAGTVHFVFRLPSAGPTLAFGGHVLRCSNIVHWVKTLLEEQANPQVTNEDLTTSAPGYLDRVEKFVKQAKANGSVDKWGGTEAVAEFLRLKAKFMSKSRPTKRSGQGSDGIA